MTFLRLPSFCASSLIIMGLLGVSLSPDDAYAHPIKDGIQQPAIPEEAPAIASTHSSENSVEIRLEGDYRYINANGLPDHATGSFPNANNPNSIRAQQYRFRVPAKPNLGNQITPDEGFWFGIALNGVPFEPGTAETWRGDQHWRYEALTGPLNLGLDEHHAHVQPSGAYHYHGIPTGLVASKTQRPTLIGYAADGFPIYSSMGYARANDPASGLRGIRSGYRLKQGDRPSNGPNGRYDGSFTADFEYVAGSGDLDECNGRTGVTPEYPEGIYHYYATESFPFIPRCFRGTPDSSFQKRRSRGGRPGHRPGGRPRPGRPPFGPESNRRPPFLPPRPHF